MTRLVLDENRIVIVSEFRAEIIFATIQKLGIKQFSDVMSDGNGFYIS